MGLTNMTKWMVPALFAGLLFVSCSTDNENPGGETGHTKNIEWEVFHEFGAGETIVHFEISDDAQWLFYTNSLGTAYRINKVTGEKSLLYALPLQFENGKLYLHVVKDSKSYFVVSDDFGATRTEFEVGTYTNYAAGWYTGTFMNLIVNRLFVMPNGDLILPHIMDKANNATYLQDNKLIAISTDGGATWNRKDSDNSYISALQGNRLFAISEAWTGVGTSQLLYSDNSGTSWQVSDLSYLPQAVDRDNNLIAASRNEIQKFKSNRWTVYTWDETAEPLVSITGLRYEGERGDDPNGRQMDDIEFDEDNNLYVMGKNRTTICRTTLD